MRFKLIVMQFKSQSFMMMISHGLILQLSLIKLQNYYFNESQILYTI